MSSGSLEKGYEPKNVEKRWYEYWEKEGLFSAGEKEGAKNYSIVIPPPNVTGVLHMGHALNNTMQDILCRYRRSRGDNVLWMPGTDHAGIATQNVVERKLAEQGITREEIGREKFIEEVWKWRKESGSAIINQLKRLGASCDWNRERFTMDEGLSKAVRKVFVQLYKEGLIYKGNYITNWCPRCCTALSDLEVEHEDVDGNLYHIKYEFSDNSGSFTVATTRPETMFGDTAVAVNPDDERYANISAKSVKLPLTDRVIPIIYDNYVDIKFGTGALKVTPAHDPNDFDIGIRHNLDSIKVIDNNAMMTAAAYEFKGMDRIECRKAVIKALEEQGLLIKIEEHVHSVGHCYRCKTIVEPNLSKQWFVKVKPLADKAIKAVKDGKTKIIPENWTKTYYDWMYNIKDWCISRQIWWGHRIPVWICEKCRKEIVTMENPTVCPDCQSDELLQESDVLDTWFSSALWPFSTMGWPEKTKLLKMYYPTSTLITGFDILFFWVARMMMMGIHFMDEIPFKDVYIHALVRDEHGKKMSKSKGNVIDPLEVIESHGTDAFRFTLAAFAAQGRDVKMSIDRVEGYRHFINKLWNAARFTLIHIDRKYELTDFNNISLADKWIMARLVKTTEEVAKALDSYKFNDAAGTIYQFVWHEFCDWYLEAIKPTLFGKAGEDAQNATKAVLANVLRDILVLLHPFTPYITEEIWHKLPGTEGSIMKAVYPLDRAVFKKFRSETIRNVLNDAEQQMNIVISIVNGIRNIRGEMHIPHSTNLDVLVFSQEKNIRETVELHKDFIINLSKLNSICVEIMGDRPKAAATALIDGATIFVSLKGVIDFTMEVARLEKEAGKITKEFLGLSKKLSNENFLDKAPAHVVEKTKAKKDLLGEKQDKLLTNIEKIKEMV